MEKTVMDNRTSNESHKKGFLAEIKRSRVKSFDSDFQDNYDFHGSAPKWSSRGGKRPAAITDTRGYKRSRAHTVRSFDHEQSEGKNDNEHKLDENDAKFNTLPACRRNMRSRPRGKDLGKIMEEQPEVDEFLRYGWLYKTSRGKITSNLIRDHHEHRQHRRFQLTEHSLEYSQLLQKVYHHAASYSHRLYIHVPCIYNLAML